MTEVSSCKLCVPDFVHAAVVEGRAVLMNRKSGRYIGFDEIATRMWELLVKHGEREVVVARLVEEYDVDIDVLRRDLDGLISDCLQQGLLTTG